MTITELISALSGIAATHGDVTVAIEDADTNWYLGISKVDYDAGVKLAVIGGEYHSEETEALGERR